MDYLYTMGTMLELRDSCIYALLSLILFILDVMRFNFTILFKNLKI